MASLALVEPIYLRQEGESDEAYRAFEMYRDTPVHQKRSYKDVADASNLTLNTVNTYGSRFCWKERALSYDRYIDAERLSQINRRRIEMQERHSLIATAMLSKVAEKVAMMSPDELTAKDAKEWLDVATRVENLARGQATQITRTVVSTEEQDRLTKEQLIREAREFFNEARMQMPGLSLAHLVSVVQEEFDVTVDDLQLPAGLLSSEIIEIEATEVEQ